MEEAEALDEGEDLFDRIVIRAVRRQEQQVVAVLGCQGFQPYFVVERRVVADDDAGFFKFRNEMIFQPFFHQTRVATAGKKHRREPCFAAQRHDQIGAAFFRMSRFVGINLAAAHRPSVRVKHGFFKARFIKINNVISAIARDKTAEFAEVASAFRIPSFGVTGGFFYACSSF